MSTHHQHLQHPSDDHKKPPFHNEKEQCFPGSESHMENKPDYGETSYQGLGRLHGLVALVTGGDSGIGRAVSLAFAREGADVAITYLEQEQNDAEETKKIVEDSGKTCLMIPCNLVEEKDCKHVVEETVKKFGRIDVLVNNAAFQGKAVTDITELEYERIVSAFKVNIIAMFAIIKDALPHMKAGSSIINVGSIEAYNPNHTILDYATTKGAIVNFTKGLAPELTKRGIRVNCVAPGPVWTPLIVQSFPKEKIQEFGGHYPLGRPAQPVELSPAFVFLASRESRYISGEVLGVTGGKHIS
eukprot:NODE_4774_length_1116_cov_68.827795_g4236_i0.p1 GENE.NODE_4774_length_1116_cov_68.827795_g4236_i0~~NODE_4774_length_1116_cov_68.827795_g4236_i0.p1  ORF type:complete len:300 (+),score=35.66 NODE_4774_length_1116_cov_68.827795_g4236_i0:60-959(+)